MEPLGFMRRSARIPIAAGKRRFLCDGADADDSSSNSNSNSEGRARGGRSMHAPSKDDSKSNEGALCSVAHVSRVFPVARAARAPPTVPVPPTEFHMGIVRPLLIHLHALLAATYRGAPSAAAGHANAIASWVQLARLLPVASLENLYRHHDDMLASTKAAVTCRRIVRTVRELVLADVTPLPAPEWHVWREARWRPLVQPLPPRAGAWDAAPLALWQLFQTARARAGLPTTHRFRFAVGVLSASFASSAALPVVYVNYVMPPHGAFVHVLVQGMTRHISADAPPPAIHVGIVTGLGLGAVALWRETPVLEGDLAFASPAERERASANLKDVFPEARAIAQAELLRLQLTPCGCPAGNSTLARWADRDMIRCACAGGLAAAATRHERTLREAGLPVVCPLTGTSDSLSLDWVPWPAPPASPRPALFTLLLQAAARFWREGTTRVRWEPAFCPARLREGLPWTAMQAQVAGSVCTPLPHIPATIPASRQCESSSEWEWHYGAPTATGDYYPTHWFCVFCAQRLPAARGTLLTAGTLWEAFVAFVKTMRAGDEVPAEESLVAAVDAILSMNRGGDAFTHA